MTECKQHYTLPSVYYTRKSSCISYDIRPRIYMQYHTQPSVYNTMHDLVYTILCMT